MPRPKSKKNIKNGETFMTPDGPRVMQRLPKHFVTTSDGVRTLYPARSQ